MLTGDNLTKKALQTSVFLGIVGATQAANELLFTLATTTDPATLTILQNVVVIGATNRPALVDPPQPTFERVAKPVSPSERELVSLTNQARAAAGLGARHSFALETAARAASSTPWGSRQRPSPDAVDAGS